MARHFISIFCFSIISMVFSKTLHIAFPTKWSICSTHEAFRALFGVSLWNCELQCLIRPKCTAVNYWRLQYVPEQCNNCDEDEVCDVDTGTCSKQECERYDVENGVVLGNMQAQGAMSSCICNQGYTLKTPITLSVCQKNGNWSYVPTCLGDCGDPPDLPNTTAVPVGATTVGAIRTYTCVFGHVIKKGGVKTTQKTDNATCDVTGSWLLDFECVDCGDPPQLPNVISVSSGDTTVGAMRTYTCAYGHTIQKGGMRRAQTTDMATCNASGSWLVDFYCVEECPLDWKRLGTSCYGFTHIVFTISKATTACQAVDPDAQLVVFNTPDEQQLLKDWYLDQVTLRVSRYTYVGGWKIGQGGWTWSDETLVTWGWDTGQPDNDYDPGCLFIDMDDFLWHDHHCHWETEALCELQLI